MDGKLIEAMAKWLGTSGSRRRLLAGLPAAALPLAQAPRARAGGHKNQTPPVPLHAPWTAGVTFVAVTFFGEDGHTDKTNDYYAVDWKRLGAGCDGDIGEPILAPAAGTVVEATDHDGGVGSGGKTVFLRLDDAPKVTVHFEHLDSVLVAAGEHVVPPRPLGTLGRTGLPDDFCAHVHVGVRKRIGGRDVSIKPGPLDGQPVRRGGPVTSRNTG